MFEKCGQEKAPTVMIRESNGGLNRALERIVRSTLRAFRLVVPDPFSEQSGMYRQNSSSEGRPTPAKAPIDVQI